MRLSQRAPSRTNSSYSEVYAVRSLLTFQVKNLKMKPLHFTMIYTCLRRLTIDGRGILLRAHLSLDRVIKWRFIPSQGTCTCSAVDPIVFNTYFSGEFSSPKGNTFYHYSD